MEVIFGCVESDGNLILHVFLRDAAVELEFVPHEIESSSHVLGDVVFGGVVSLWNQRGQL